MSECAENVIGCKCVQDSQTKDNICVCTSEYIARDGICQSKKCYDSLTDTFCGNFPGAICDNTKHICVCNRDNLKPTNGRCIADNCITDTSETGETTECWGRGYCRIDYGGGNCVCFDAYIDRARCIACNPEVAVEKPTGKLLPECIPKVCLDPENLDPNVICNGHGTCEPRIQPNSAITYVCVCNSNFANVKNSCYPLECIVTSLSAAEQYTVCNGYGTCDLLKKVCHCTYPYTGEFCRSCFPAFDSYYKIVHNAIIFECISRDCFNVQTNSFCGGYGLCVKDTETQIYKCVCNEGAAIHPSSSTLCVPILSLRRNMKKNELLSIVIITILLTLGLLGLTLYFLADFLILKKKDKEQKAYIKKRKIEIARSLHRDVRQESDILATRSVLSTSDYISSQRRYL